jgi:hypothetical protein
VPLVMDNTLGDCRAERCHARRQHTGTRPPWSGRPAMPERFTRSFSHQSRARPAGALIGFQRLLVRLHTKRQTDVRRWSPSSWARRGYSESESRSP